MVFQQHNNKGMSHVSIKQTYKDSFLKKIFIWQQVGISFNPQISRKKTFTFMSVGGNWGQAYLYIDENHE